MKKGFQVVEVEPAGSDVPALGTAAESEEQRILDAGRACFVESGYVSTSVLAVAARAHVAPEVLYRQFRSKCALFLAVFDQAEEVAYGRLRSVARAQSTFAAGVESVLDEVRRLSREDPSPVRFLGTVGADMSHIAELRAARSDHWPHRQAFLAELIEVGEATGELAGVDRFVVADTIAALIEGLWQIDNLLPGAQSGAIEGYKRLMTGTLLESVPSSE